MRNERFLEERKGAASGDSVTSGGVGARRGRLTFSVTGCFSSEQKSNNGVREETKNSEEGNDIYMESGRMRGEVERRASGGERV